MRPIITTIHTALLVVSRFPLLFWLLYLLHNTQLPDILSPGGRYKLCSLFQLWSKNSIRAYISFKLFLYVTPMYGKIPKRRDRGRLFKRIWVVLQNSSLPLGEGLGQFKFSVSTTMELPSPWSPQLWIFLHHSIHSDRFAFAMVSIWLPLSLYRRPIHRRNSSSLHKNDWCSSFGKYQALYFKENFTQFSKEFHTILRRISHSF